MSKLDGIKAGDRVRVTFEGVVTDSGRDAGLRLAAEHDIVWVGAKTNRSHDHFQITRIEPELKIGDSAVAIGCLEGVIIAKASNGHLIMEYKVGDDLEIIARPASCFTHA